MINTQAVQALIDTLAEKFAEDAVIVDAIKAVGLINVDTLLAAQAAVATMLGRSDRVAAMLSRDDAALRGDTAPAGGEAR